MGAVAAGAAMRETSIGWFTMPLLRGGIRLNGTGASIDTLRSILLASPSRLAMKSSVPVDMLFALTRMLLVAAEDCWAVAAEAATRGVIAAAAAAGASESAMMNE